MRILHVLGIAAAGFAVACSQDFTGPPASDTTPSPPALDQSALQSPFAGDRTPFQSSLMATMAERRARGLPVPAAVTYAFEEQPAPASGNLMLLQSGGGTRHIARTVIQFETPAEAGRSAWPALLVRGTVPEGVTGFIREGDYTDVTRRMIAERYPGANTTLETAPRTYTITETITEPAPAGEPSLLGLTDQHLQQLTTSGNLLMGFTVPGPNLDYHIEYNLTICVVWVFGCWVEWEIVDFWAGFKLDWTIATRLPMSVSLTSDDPVTEGSTFSPVTAATGVDWSASDYALAGVPEEDGNEFILRFILKTGVFLSISYIDVVNLGVDVNLDEASTFTTPLGAGAMFALPTFRVSLAPAWLHSLGVADADFGIGLTPLAGSDRFTADWAASSAGSGSGTVTYSTSGAGVPLGNIQADDGPGNAAVQLSGFQYHFTQFGLNLGVYFYLMVAGWEHTWDIPVTGFDLGGLMGGLYLNTHAGTPATLDLLVPVTNVAPVAVLSRAGTTNIAGHPTFLVPAGGTLTFSGTATDPGRDDLTLTWDWADGTPPVSTTYPVPHSVTASQSHTFSDACLYQVAFRATDDDQATGTDQVPVLVTGQASNVAQLDGWWQHQLGRRGAMQVDETALRCYLAIAAHMSAVLGEVRDIGTIARAYDVLHMQRNRGDPREQFDRELLVVWLNYAHGAIGHTELVDTDGDLVADTPFADAVSAAEEIRRDPSAAAQAIRAAAQLLHRISENAIT